MLKWMNVKQIVSKICFIAFTKSKGIQWFGDDAYSNVELCIKYRPTV